MPAICRKIVPWPERGEKGSIRKKRGTKKKKKELSRKRGSCLPKKILILDLWSRRERQKRRRKLVAEPRLILKTMLKGREEYPPPRRLKGNSDQAGNAAPSR